MARFDTTFNVNGNTQTVTLASGGRIRAKSKHYFYAVFNFSNNDPFLELEGLSATFSPVPFERSRNGAYIIPLEADNGVYACEIPWEVLTRKGKVYVGIFGGDMLVTDEAEIEITHAAPVLGADSQPTQSWWGKFSAALATLAAAIAGKQDQLTAGENITIEDNVISATGGGSSIEPYTNTPQMDLGNGSAGSSPKYARGDHRHPSDTSKAPAPYIMEWNYSSEAGGWVTQADAGDFYTALEQWRIYGVPIEVQVYAMTGSAPHKVIYFTNFLEWFDNGSDYFSWTTVNYEEWGHVYLYEFTFVRTNNGFTTGMLDAGELAWENDIPSVPNPANTAPKDLAASAAIGTSTRYARADHIHAKPTYTASDVGALPSNTTFVSSVNGQSGAVTVAVPSAATATPSDLGTAAVGTSVKYAREDHVHNKPSAADVGALAAPVSASSGDVLTYDGSAWGAASAPTGIYWCTYGTTTNAEIETAYAANKLVCVKYDNHVYVLVGRGSATSHSFSLPYYVSTPAIYSVHCSGNVWNASSKILIGAPSSPSAGDTLVYDGSAWVAQNPTPEVTVSSAGAVTQALDAGKIYHFTGAVTSLTITLNAVSGVPAQYHFDFTEGSTAFDPTLPSSVVLPDGHTWEADTHYEVDILNNYAVVVGWTVS